MKGIEIENLYLYLQGDANGQYWLGAIRDETNPKSWQWINGEEVTVSFWNLPGGNENCARFDGCGIFISPSKELQESVAMLL